MTRRQFLAKVIARNTDPKTGELRDPRLLDRLDHPTCRQCQKRYRKKFPGKPFQIDCQGIWTDDDYRALAKKAGLSLAELKEVMDVPTWAAKHIKIVDENGNMQPFIARDYQLAALSCTAKRIVNRWGRGLGKRLNIDTPIPTPDGWTTMGKLKIGDLVFDDRGQPTRVCYVSPIELAADTYNVVFSDGSVIHADAEHLWEVWSVEDGAPRFAVRTTSEIRRTLRDQDGSANHFIPAARPLEYRGAMPIFSPRAIARDVAGWLWDSRKSETGLKTNYLRAPVQWRRRLLEELILAAGSMMVDGRCMISGWPKAPVESLYELIVGLGLPAELRLRSSSRYPAYELLFPPPAILRGESLRRYIVDIQPAKSALMRCIEVDSPNHLYLAGRSCIPTHNTSVGIIKELHRATTRKNYPILVVCPAKAQAQYWFDQINTILENDRDLARTVAHRRQQPYYQFRFTNGSTISIFTAGSQSGRDADQLRSQSPRRVHCEEQDQLTPGDYKAIMPLLRRFKNSEFHGSSTPTGKRETFWEMCTKYPDYQEFHFPIDVHPDFSPEFEAACRREARTDLVYLHEYKAEFGDEEGGVFKGIYIDQARKDYSYSKQKYSRQLRYFLGVDWNGRGTGTRIRVVAYDPDTKIRRVVAARTVTTSVMDSIEAIRDLNRRWHCEQVYIDSGFGQVQDELIRLIGHTSKDPDDARLIDMQVIDFGANISTNRLVPKRGYEKYLQKQQLERRTKPFMVEGAVMCLEQGLFEFSEEDQILEEQLRAYRVKTWSQHGWANTYEAGAVGDHDLDAVMLALLGIELKYGLFKSDARARRATVDHLPDFNVPELDPFFNRDRKEKDDPGLTEEKRELLRAVRGVPSRTVPREKEEAARHARLLHAGRGAFVVTPPVGKNGRRTSRLLSRPAKPQPGRPGQIGRTRSQKAPDWLPPGSRFLGRRPL